MNRRKVYLFSTIVLIVLMLWNFWPKKQIFYYRASLAERVAMDAEDQYNIVAKRGDLRQMRHKAAMVAEAWLHAKDEANYIIWKDREDSISRASWPRY